MYPQSDVGLQTSGNSLMSPHLYKRCSEAPAKSYRGAGEQSCHGAALDTESDSHMLPFFA